MRLDPEQTWDLVGFTAAALVGMATRQVLQSTWERATDDEPPLNPAAPGTTWTSALLWGGLSGAAIGLTRVVARRVAAGAWRTAENEPPPM